MYQLLKHNDQVIGILDTSRRASIPLDPDNTDYQAYLKWVAEGNTPEPADEPN
jgi:hypothetical protein